MSGENFQISSVQITWKFICETSANLLHDLIISPYVKEPSINFP